MDEPKKDKLDDKHIVIGLLTKISQHQEKQTEYLGQIADFVRTINMLLWIAAILGIMTVIFNSFGG